jgi:ribosome-interacting GTPase 1
MATLNGSFVSQTVEQVAECIKELFDQPVKQAAVWGSD